MRKTLLWCLLAAVPLAAQGRDFLTVDEVDQIREAQEPNPRMEAYAKFARKRVDLVKYLLANDKPGRSAMIHDALDEYAKIVDAMDDVADAALARKTDLKAGLRAQAGVEHDALAAFRKLRESRPKDLERYELVLRTAIETTQDSLELADGDMGKRMRDVMAREEREKKAAGTVMTSEQKKSAEKADFEEQNRKVPSLYRPGEKKQDEKKQ